jgi:hypothetical protein
VAKIALKGGGAIDCTVRNLSAAGACIEVATPFGIPNEFSLLIESGDVQHPRHVVWREQNRTGVKFASP